MGCEYSLYTVKGNEDGRWIPAVTGEILAPFTAEHNGNSRCRAANARYHKSLDALSQDIQNLLPNQMIARKTGSP